jgi:hypothetical protein
MKDAGWIYVLEYGCICVPEYDYGFMCICGNDLMISTGLQLFKALFLK